MLFCVRRQNCNNPWRARALTALCAFIAACSQSPKPSANKGPDKTDDALPDDNQGPDPKQDLSLEEILRQCGVKDEDLNDPEKVLFEKTIRSWPKVFSGSRTEPIIGTINYRVSVTTVLTIKSTSVKNEQNVDFDIQALPTQAEGEAREKIVPLRGNTISTQLNAEERATLASDKPEWDGIYCTINPVKRISSNKGGKSKVITFDPPLPSSISPLADPARYQAEIGQGKTFSGIKAKIESSSDPALSVGQTLTGTVTIAPASPTLTLAVGATGAGGTKSLTADAAYKLTWNFGSVTDTTNLGLVPEQTMFFTHSNHDIKAIVVNSGDPEIGVIVMAEGL